MKKRISIDMDGVIADLLTPWLDKYNSDYSDGLKPSDITLWNWHSVTKEPCGDKIYEYLDDPELFENLPVIEGSIEVAFDLSKDYELFICSAVHNLNNIVPKAKWLQKHFPFIDEKNYVFTRNKSILNSQYLIDDKPDNFINYKGQGILFTAPHNLTEFKHPRVDNWKQAAEYFDWVEGLRIIGD